MSLPAVMYQQRDPRCVLDWLHATGSLAPPVACHNTAVQGAVINCDYRRLITTQLLPRVIVLITLQGKRGNMSVTVCWNKVWSHVYRAVVSTAMTMVSASLSVLVVMIEHMLAKACGALRNRQRQSDYLLLENNTVNGYFNCQITSHPTCD